MLAALLPKRENVKPEWNQFVIAAAPKLRRETSGGLEKSPTGTQG
jgi:hypothetical protein